jgi:hypothetical protein
MNRLPYPLFPRNACGPELTPGAAAHALELAEAVEESGNLASAAPARKRKPLSRRKLHELRQARISERAHDRAARERKERIGLVVRKMFDRALTAAILADAPGPAIGGKVFIMEHWDKGRRFWSVNHASCSGTGWQSIAVHAKADARAAAIAAAKWCGAKLGAEAK